MTAVQAGPRREAADPAALDVLRATAFAAWGRGPTATYHQWFEDAFQEGWIGLEKALASGRPVENWQGYVVESGRNYLRRMHDKGRRTTYLDDGGATLVDPGAAERFDAVDDQAERLQRATVVRQVLAEEFDERERQLIRLKYELQRDDRQIAALTGLSPRAVKRQFSGKREKGRPGINQRLARYIGPAPDESLLCRGRRSQVKALVGGWRMSDARKAKVQAHLRTCEGCRTFAQRALGYQMLLPPVALPLALAADPSGADALAQMAHALQDGAGTVDQGHAAGLPAAATDLGGSAAADPAGAGGALAERAVALKQYLADALAAGKQQAFALHARVAGLDPGTLPAVRPGAVAGAVAGCIAVGSGATYCVTQGVPDSLRAPLGIAQTHQPAERQEATAEPPEEPTRASGPPATPPAAPPPAPTVAEAKPADPAPAPLQAAQTPARVEQANFGIEPQPQTPRPAPPRASSASNGGGVAQQEFGVP